jgi:ubiquinone/menaquinone biosynthesis C-methylase UbiE
LASLHEAEVGARFDSLVDRFKRELPASDARLDAVVRNLPEIKNPLVLDLGCGKGRFARHLEARGAKVVGLDLSANMLREATGLSCIRASARQLPFCNACFDVVIAVECLEHIHPIDQVLFESRRVLKPGGRLIIVDKNALSMNAQRPWLPSVFVKWIDERRGLWMYPADSQVREHWFIPNRFKRQLARSFESISIDYLMTNQELNHILFRYLPVTRLMTCWTATVPGGRA